MRTIEISTAVFAKIWAHRRAGEETEDAILQRLLGAGGDRVDPALQPKGEGGRKVLWRDDVRQALTDLGREAHLDAIYKRVREIRRQHGRSLPSSADAIIRRELEHNSSDSESYLGNYDWFKSVEGIGAGVWGLR